MNMRIAKNVEMLELGGGECYPVMTWGEEGKILALIDADISGQTTYAGRETVN
ncbi:hypothetical protein FACS189490_12740 [Clostridia bacterium]|nr:hypothetical protein FACS189490_12740 [Clostridia bacterium]